MINLNDLFLDETPVEEIYGPATPEHGEEVTPELCAAMAAYKPEFARYWRNTAKIVKKNAELLALRAESPSAQWIHEACKSILR